LPIPRKFLLVVARGKKSLDKLDWPIENHKAHSEQASLGGLRRPRERVKGRKMVDCWKCANPLTDADQLGSSLVCPKCGGVTRPDGTPKRKTSQEPAGISDARRAARTATRLLLALLVCMPFILIGFVIVAKAFDMEDEAFEVGTYAGGLVLACLTVYAHKLREAAVADDGKSRWKNLL